MKKDVNLKSNDNIQPFFFATKRLAAHLRSAEIVQLNLETHQKYSEIRKSWSFEPVATGDFHAEKGHCWTWVTIQYKGIIRAMNRQCWNFRAPKSHVVPCYPILLSHVISCSFSHFVVQAKHVGYLNAERKGKAGARETFRRLSVCAWRWLWLRSCQSFLCCRKTVWTSQHQSCRQRFSIHSYVHSELSACIILCPKCQTW